MNSDNSMNVYPQINFMKYFGQMIKKHKFTVLFSGLLIGSMLLAFSYIQSFTSSTILRFRGDAATSVPALALPIGGMGKTENTRDVNFTYIQSMPFYIQLSRDLIEHPEGRKIVSVFQKSKNNDLVRIKRLFYDSPSFYREETVVVVAHALKKILTFKKEHENGLIMYLRTGTPEFSLKLGKLLGKLITKVIIKNETLDLEVTSAHLKELLTESQTNLVRLNEEILQHEENQHFDHGSRKTGVAMMDTEKDLRLAKIEVQRLNLLIKGLEDELNKNSTYSLDNRSYRYIDQVGMERLEELKRERKSAVAKVSSISATYEKMKLKNLELPIAEQIETNLIWDLNLEKAINKDLVLRSRDIDGKIKSTENLVIVNGDTTLLPYNARIAKPIKFFIGFILGVFASLIGIYYYYDFFKVIRGQKDLRSRAEKHVLNSIPLLRHNSRKLDIWKELPQNHHIMESFRFLMEFSLEQKVVTFVSSGKSEGKSFIISNLAENLTRFGKKVLVVDTNFVNPTISKALQEKPDIKVVSGESFKHEKEEILDRSLLVREIKTHSKDCDVVLIDTQNLHVCNDALIAASVSNSTVVVASYLETYYYKLDDVLRKLQVAEISQITFLLNKANINDEIIKGRPRALDDVEANTLYLRKSS